MVEQTPDVIAAEKDLRRFLHEDHGREYREKILKRFISTFRVQANRQYERLIRIAEHGIRHPPRDDFSNTEIEPADITV
jgi:Zn-finger domain-containing protein